VNLGARTQLNMGCAVGLLLAVGASVVCVTARAQAASVCRISGVEMIIGGTPQAACSVDPPSAGRRMSVASISGERIAPEVQHERDRERRRILEDELQRERSAMARLLKQGAAADAAALARTESNLAALQRELARGGP
jgi:hypothetical protein